MIDTVTQQISLLKNEQGKPLFANVKSAVNIVNAMSKPIVASPSVHIVLLEESPLDKDLDVGAKMQRVKITLGILIGLRSGGRAKDDNAELTFIRQKINQALFGWIPKPNYQPFSKALCNVQKLQDQQLFWMERFSTTYYLESIL